MARYEVIIDVAHGPRVARKVHARCAEAAYQSVRSELIDAGVEPVPESLRRCGVADCCARGQYLRVRGMPVMMTRAPREIANPDVLCRTRRAFGWR